MTVLAVMATQQHAAVEVKMVSAQALMSRQQGNSWQQSTGGEK